jgi:hypothetical protein
MLFVMLQSTTLQNTKNNLTRYLGQELPRLVNEEVISVQLDGLELSYVLERFQYIPVARRSHISGDYKPVQQWFGDVAKFIYHNLEWQ